VSFGGIPAAAADVRSSDWICCQSNADATQLERAQQLAQAKDAGSCSGTKLASKFSLASISDEGFLNRATMLGVSLGNSPSKVSATIANIKSVDDQRTLTMLKNNLEVKLSADGHNNNVVIEHAE
jgi:hypothetical protein